jgi:hypothetical protein
MILRKVQYFLLAILLLLTSCKSYYNETIHWMDSIPKGMSIDSVKLSQPSFVEIDWNDPKLNNSTKSYYIKRIRNNRDILKMSHKLVFVKDRFEMRISKK